MHYADTRACAQWEGHFFQRDTAVESRSQSCRRPGLESSLSYENVTELDSP